jgi:hypothetical protein
MQNGCGPERQVPQREFIRKIGPQGGRAMDGGTTNRLPNGPGFKAPDPNFLGRSSQSKELCFFEVEARPGARVERFAGPYNWRLTYSTRRFKT